MFSLDTLKSYILITVNEKLTREHIRYIKNDFFKNNNYNLKIFTMKFLRLLIF